MNPLLSYKFGTPHETIPFNEISPADIEEAVMHGIEEEKKLIEEIVQSDELPTFGNTILPKTDFILNRAACILFNLLSAHTNDELNEIAQRVSPLMTEHSNAILQNTRLFERIKYVYAHQENLNDEEKVLLKKTYESFERNGANLNEDQKKIFTELQMELSRLTLQFNQNNLNETNAYQLHILEKDILTGLPDTILEAAAQTAKESDKEGWIFTLHAPSYIPFMTYADNRALRKEMYMAKNTLCAKENENNNFELVRKIASLRKNISQILGHKNHAEYVLKHRMAENVENVYEFINQINEAYLPKAKEEIAELKDIAQDIEGDDFELMPWDTAYYSHKLKLRNFNLDAEMLRPYFELEKVKEGIFALANNLYGITFKQTHEIQTYHPEVETYEVFDKDNSFLAILYLDFFPRESKQSGAWMTSYQEQYIDESGMDMRPHVSITMNLTKATQVKPSLLTLSEVETFLHEFGHALHGIFSKVRFESLSGTNVYWDFVELPSQIMENYATEPEFLNTFARHYQTNECIPQELIDKVLASKNFQCGTACVRQLSFCLLDMAYHTLTEELETDILSFEKKAWEATQLLPQLPETCMSTQFSHIFSGGYSAGYYSYKWAEVLDADAFAQFKQYGIFNKDTAQKFRENILSKGGTLPPMELYEKFRGKKPSINALLSRNGIKQNHKQD